MYYDFAFKEKRGAQDWGVYVEKCGDAFIGVLNEVSDERRGHKGCYIAFAESYEVVRFDHTYSTLSFNTIFLEILSFYLCAREESFFSRKNLAFILSCTTRDT